VRSPRSILITGASSGIGAALALAYASTGARLALGGRHEARLAAIAERCRAGGAPVTTAVVDTTDEAAVAHWVAATDDEAPLDLVIANAGISGGHRRDGSGEDPDEVLRIMQVNFAGTCHTIHPVLPRMRARRRGQIALMSSIAALRGLPYSPAYCASKAAVLAYGEALRGWLHPQGVEVSIVLPGFVDTPMAGRVSSPKPFQMSADRAAQRIRHGLERGQARIAFPTILSFGTRLMSLFPAALVDPALAMVNVDIGHSE
jgi:short-subunit dehydrogenase